MGVIEPTQHTLKDGRTVTIRSADVIDAAAVLKHGRAVLTDNDFAGREADELAYTEEEEAKLIQKHRAEAGELWLVAESDGGIVGSIIFSTGPTRRLAHRGAFGLVVT